MDIRQLEAYVYTVRSKSFSLAARELYLTQPTVSAHIHALEKELHTRLIKRTTKEFAVTEQGKQLYSYALSILELRDKALYELSDSAKKVLHIGASTVPALYYLPEKLAIFHEKYPDIALYTSSLDSLDVIRHVKEGTLDIGFVGTCTDDPSCTFRPVAEDELVLAAPNTEYYRKLLRDHAPLNVLLKEPVIVREENSGTWIETEALLERANISKASLNIVARMDHPEAIKSSIIHGLGVSVLSKKTTLQAQERGELLAFSLGDQAFKRNLFLVYRTDSYLPCVTEKFIQLL